MVGTGVLSHDLGLGGHLARAVSAVTGRGIRVEVVPLPGIGIADAPRQLRKVDLGRFDAVVIAVGINDALAGTRFARWEGGVRELLDVCEQELPPGGFAYLLDIVDPSLSPLFRRLPARLAGLRARRFNAISHRLVGSRPRMGTLHFEFNAISDPTRMYDSTDYRRWAHELAPAIAGSLLSQR